MASLPTRSLPKRPDLNQLKRQAKELLESFTAGDAGAVAEVNAHYRNADPARFALHDAQLVLARAYGFESWPKLKAHVDGLTVTSLVEAVRGGDLQQVRAMLKTRPELARMSADNLQVVHHAVLRQSPDIVRLLMELGANAREGVYPHREATSALAIATERGYDEIVAIIVEQEQRRVSGTLPSEDLRVPPGFTPLHAAARMLDTAAVTRLLDHGSDVGARGDRDLTALDMAAHASGADSAQTFAEIAALLISRGAELTAPAAVALGDEDWLRARLAQGAFVNQIEDSGGLLRIAASHHRREILALLLNFGFDPDERKRFGDVGGDVVVFTWGMPLWHCASSGKYEMAEMLLDRGADPNAEVYASGTPLYQAYGCRDWRMVELLQRFGGRPDATLAGLYRQTELAKRLLVEDSGKAVAERMLWAGACGGDPEIVRMALERVDWPRDDLRWFEILEQPLRIWNHGSGHWANPEWDRGTYLECFHLVLERCDPNIRGRVQDRGQFGLTILHSVAGSRGHMTPEERVAFASLLLNAGASLDVRDNLLGGTPLDWARRQDRTELVELFSRLRGGA